MSITTETPDVDQFHNYFSQHLGLIVAVYTMTAWSLVRIHTHLLFHLLCFYGAKYTYGFSSFTYIIFYVIFTYDYFTKIIFL